MSFVVVNTATRCAVRHPRSGRETYSTGSEESWLNVDFEG